MTTIQNAIIFDEICTRCEQLTPAAIARLEVALRDYGLPLAGDVVRQCGIANCGAAAYAACLAEVDPEVAATVSEAVLDGECPECGSPVNAGECSNPNCEHNARW